MELLNDLIGGLVLPLLHINLRLLLQVGDVGRACLSFHLGVLRQLQLLKAFKLWDPVHTHTQIQIQTNYIFCVICSFAFTFKAVNENKAGIT